MHVLPKFEIYIDEHLSFTIRFFLWRLPHTHEIYSQYGGSLKNITLSNIIKTLLNYYVCSGLSHSFAGSVLEHSVPEIFSLTQENISPHVKRNGIVHLPECLKSETKVKLSLKRKRDNMMSRAKPNAPVSLTSPDRLNLALQSYRLENKTLKEEISKMKEEISNNSMPVDVDLEDIWLP